MYKILLVEDDVNIGVPLSGILEMRGYQVLYLTNGDKVMKVLQQFKPDVIILDVLLNGILDGFEIGRLIRTKTNIPILFTTSLDGNEDFKAGFSIENTDYVRKPYRLMEVLMRINNLLSNHENLTKCKDIFQLGLFSFFPTEQSLRYDYEEIHLNNYESAVLELLCNNMNEFVSKNKIIETVWHEKQTKLKEGSLNNILTIIRKYLNKEDSIILKTKIKLGIKLSIIEK
jgi:DNA-binding response OmpR family regulator